MELEDVFRLIANYGFPIVLSIFLLWRIDFFFSQMLENQKEFSKTITLEMVKIKQGIYDLRNERRKSDKSLIL